MSTQGKLTTAGLVRPVDHIEQTLLDFLQSRTKVAWQPDLDLFAAGAVKSMFAMELVVYLEATFGVSVEGEELTLDNFRTVRSMAALVRRLRGQDAEAAGD